MRHGSITSRGAVGLALFCLSTTAAFDGPCGVTPKITTPHLTIRGQRVELEVARTPEQQTRGLGYRDSLAWGHGMLFLYEHPSFYAFWMKGMRFDIDIVWIRDGRIVDISHRVPHSADGPGPTVRPREVADTVLEVPASYAEVMGWRIGDRVELSLEDSAEGAPRG